jgi:tetratricopeptide (TPR) repeat protein
LLNTRRDERRNVDLISPVKPLIKRKVKDLAHYLKEGQMNLSSGSYELAQENFELAIMMDSSSSEAFQGLGDSLRSLGRLENAVKAYEKAFKLDPGRPLILERKAMTYLAMRKNMDARETLMRVIRMEPKRREVWHLLGLTDLRMGRYEEALDCFDQAISITPSDKFSHQGRGDALLEMGMFREALEAYRSALSLDPEMPKAKRSLARLRDRIDKERHQKRRDRLRQSIDDPQPKELEGLDELEEE